MSILQRINLCILITGITWTFGGIGVVSAAEAQSPEDINRAVGRMLDEIEEAQKNAKLIDAYYEIHKKITRLERQHDLQNSLDRREEGRKNWSILGKRPNTDDLRTIGENIYRLAKADGGIDKILHDSVKTEEKWYKENTIIADYVSLLNPDWTITSYNSTLYESWLSTYKIDEYGLLSPYSGITSAGWPWVIHIKPPRVTVYTPSPFYNDPPLSFSWIDADGMLHPAGGFPGRWRPWPMTNNWYPTSAWANFGSNDNEWGLSFLRPWGSGNYSNGKNTSSSGKKGWNLNLSYNSSYSLGSPGYWWPWTTVISTSNGIISSTRTFNPYYYYTSVKIPIYDPYIDYFATRSIFDRRVNTDGAIIYAPKSKRSKDSSSTLSKIYDGDKLVTTPKNRTSIPSYALRIEPLTNAKTSSTTIINLDDLQQRLNSSRRVKNYLPASAGRVVRYPGYNVIVHSRSDLRLPATTPNGLYKSGFKVIYPRKK